MTLRDELAAVLGPGNDDATAYAQADSVLKILNERWAQGVKNVRYNANELQRYYTVEIMDLILDDLASRYDVDLERG